MFSRQLFLGEGLDTNQIDASYNNGVLRLVIAVAEQAKPRKVQITAGDQGGPFRRARPRADRGGTTVSAAAPTPGRRWRYTSRGA